MSVAPKTRWHFETKTNKGRTVLSTDAVSHPRRTKSSRLLYCYVWRMKQYFNVKLWFTTPRTSKTRPRSRAKFLKSALGVWFTNYEILTRNEETWRWMAGWLTRDSADRSSVIHSCGCDVLLIELRASLLHINLLAPELFFLILAHTVYKMWITQKPNKLELWYKLHSKERKRRRVHTMFKIFGTYICWINI